ncbi:unnamed protein product [Boreogadus saida]
MKKFLQNQKGRYSFRQGKRGSTYPPKDFFLNMPSSNQGWPEDFGFKMAGTGPTYILSVEEGSSAHLAGLQPGDQVLEVEGQNVSTLGAQAVAGIAQTQKNIPPSIGVVSRIQQVSHRGQRLIVPLIEDNRVSFSITSSCITVFQYFFFIGQRNFLFFTINYLNNLVVVFDAMLLWDICRR